MAAYDIRRVTPTDVAPIFNKYHGYKKIGAQNAYTFAVFEGEKIVAAFVWGPPAPGAAKNICPEEPQAVLALRRMVAVPKTDRLLKHISKPLMVQMKTLIDRTRWPVLVTYADLGQGHTGYVYQCSGWEQVGAPRAVTHTVDEAGARVSLYSNGATSKSAKDNIAAGRRVQTEIVRFEHWACPRGGAADWWAAHGWIRRPIPGKVWKSGNQAYEIINQNWRPY